jgi:hypothetical protein
LSRAKLQKIPGDLSGAAVKFRRTFQGIAAKMPKHEKPQKGQKKLLDTFAIKKALQGRKTVRHDQRRRPTRRNPPKKIRRRPAEAVPSRATQLLESERPKKGRPTIPDNFLLGSRNAWLFFFEESWPEIGWWLLEIRNQENSTIENVRKAFAPVEGRHNCGLATVFLQGSPQPVDGKELRANRIRNSRFQDEIRKMQPLRLELQRECDSAKTVLKEATKEDKKAIKAVLKASKARLFRLEEKLHQAEYESKALDKKVRDQETYWYCSQLLDFLRKRRYTAEPFNLANALAGLPQMGWRESFVRCSKMPRSFFVRFPYRTFQVISRIWRCRPKDLKDTPMEFFREQILKLPRKDDGIRDSLCQAWRDLRLAIEDCWRQEHRNDFMPYAITSAFIGNRSRSKTASDLILDKHEKLSAGNLE